MSTKTISQLIAVLVTAAGLKAWYSLAPVNDLWIVLTPTTWLVELVTGETFRFESYSGYVNADHTFLIAAACSGINFWIMAFLMLGVLRLWSARERAVRWWNIPGFLLIAYLTTLIANTVRISIAL